MLIDMREAMANRACEAIDNIRVVEIQQALQLSPSAALVLAQMEADRSGVDAETMHFRNQPLMARLIGQIQSALGKDATLTENRIITLTPFGRWRLKKALSEAAL